VNYSYLNAIWITPFLAAAIALPTALKWKRLASVISAVLLAVPALLSTYMVYLIYVSGFKPFTTSLAWFTISSTSVTVGLLGDGLSAIMALVVSWISFMISVYSCEYMEGDSGAHRYWFFFDFFVGSMLLLVLSNNIVVMLVGWEGTTLSSYALIGHWYTDEEDKWVGDRGKYALGVPTWSTPSSSGVRAMVFTSFADIGFIIGIGMLYSASGTLSLYTISQEMPTVLATLNKQGMLVPFLFLFSLGAFAKSAQFPFHEWLVTAMTGPTSVSALIHAATMVNAGVYFMLRFMPMVISAAAKDGLSGAVSPFFLYTAAIGALTAFMMASMAVVSRELKLILAFSTASQLGYMFLSIGLAAYVEPSVALFAAFSHMISQALFKAALFLAAGALIHEFSSRYINDMKGAWHGMKWTTVGFAFASLSLAGIPPFSGFWDKDLILDLAFRSGLWYLYVLASAGAFMTAFYIFRAFALIFAGKPEREVREPGRAMLLPYVVLGLLTLAFGVIWPLPVGVSLWMYRAITLDSYARLALETLPPLEFLPLSISLTMALLGLGAALYIYSERRQIFSANGKSGIASFLHSFLYDRWLINSLYYRIIVYGFSAASQGLELIERDGFDEFYHAVLPSAFSSISVRLRGLQTGVISKYLAAFFAGLLLVLMIYVVFLLVG